MKKIIILISLGVLLIVCGCSGGNTGTRFVDPDGNPEPNLRIVKDTATGCEYLTKRTTSSGFTPIAGSCPELSSTVDASKEEQNTEK